MSIFSNVPNNEIVSSKFTLFLEGFMIDYINAALGKGIIWEKNRLEST